MKNFRDIEQLSSYLDGQLSPSESARVESRISSDPELASAYNDISSARGILRKLPARKAPRNFTLTRQMVGLKPPLPRSYSAFRFSTAFAAFLLMLTFAANVVVPRISFGAAAPQEALGIGGGGSGGACEPPSCTPPALAPLATEAPLAASELAAPATEAPLATNADAAREVVTPTPEVSTAKETVTESVSQDQSQAKREAIVPLVWQIVLLIVGSVSALIAFVMSRNARKKWS